MDKFQQPKRKLSELQVPQELEQRLHKAIAKQPKKRNKAPLFLLVAAALMLLFVSFNINTFAYYGKKLFGYEQLMDDTLAQLNEAGAGQAVNQSITMRDGTTVTIDGVLSDTNRFIVYYKAHNPNQSLENGITFTEISGFLTNHFSGTMHELSSDQHTLTGIAYFDAINPFAKKLTATFFDAQYNEYKLTFPYNAKDALATTLKHSINKKIKTDIGTFTLKNLTSTNASTLITGTFDNTTDRTFTIPRDFVLYADDKAISVNTSSMRSSLFGGYSMELLFDTIPPDTKNLEIRLEQFYSKEKIDLVVPLSPVPEGIIGPKELQILNITKQNDYTELTIRSEADVIYDKVSLQTTNDTVPLQTTKNFYDDGSSTRTLLFETTDEAMKLIIENMYFLEQQNDTIVIPIN